MCVYKARALMFYAHTKQDLREIAMNERHYVLDGNPIALKRPRLANDHLYDPHKQQKFSAGIQLASQHEGEPLTQALGLTVTFFLQLHKTARKTKNQVPNAYHKQRPDLDNLLKFLLDAANGVIYQDDSQIASLTATKRYSHIPRTEVDIIILSNE